MSTSLAGRLCGWLFVTVAALTSAPYAAAADAAADYDARLRAAGERAGSDDTADAIRLLTELTRSHPERPEAFNNLAVLYARQGDLNRARELLARAIGTHPSYATSYQNLNAVLAELAARAYGQALQASSNDRPQPQLALIERAPAVAAPATAATVPTTTRPDAASSEPRATVSATAAAPTPAGVDDAQAHTAEVLATVHAWAQAWSAQDVGRYLAHYDRRFRPARGLSRSQWERQREKRLTRPSFIDVEIVRPTVRFAEPELAVVRFKQRYRSSSLRSDVTKVLRLRKRDDGWRILEERV